MNNFAESISLIRESISLILLHEDRHFLVIILVGSIRCLHYVSFTGILYTPKSCKSRNDERHGSNVDTSNFIQSLLPS